MPFKSGVAISARRALEIMFYSPFKMNFNDLQPNHDIYVVILGIGELYKKIYIIWKSSIFGCLHGTVEITKYFLKTQGEKITFLRNKMKAQKMRVHLDFAYVNLCL